MGKLLYFLLVFCLCSCIKLSNSVQSVQKTLEYSFVAGDDMDLLFGFSATYKTADNKIVTEKIEMLPWKKEIQVNKGFVADLKISFKKASKIVDKGTYNVGFESNITINDAVTKGTRGVLRNDTGVSKIIKFSLKVPAGIDPNDVNITIPYLKYNKHFAFSYTVDDSSVGAYAKLWRRINQKWIDDIEFFHAGVEPSTGYMPKNTLTYTDGCGNDRRFAVGVGIWATNGNKWSPTFVQDASISTSNPYITWEELTSIVDFGGSVYYHNVNEQIYDKSVIEDIVKGFADDRIKALEKLGRTMKTFAHPDGNIVYLTAAETDNNICFYRSNFLKQGIYTPNHIYLNNNNSLYKERIYSGFTDDFASKLNEIREQSISMNPYWVCLTTHRVNNDFIKMIEQIENLYGKGGEDNIWFATMDEIYEYNMMRKGSIINKTISGDILTYEVSVPSMDNFYYNDLSFLVSGIKSKSEIKALSDNIIGVSSGLDGDNLLVNINFNPTILKLVDKYTAKYEMMLDEGSKNDANYFISMLLPDLAIPYLKRVEKSDNVPMAISSFVVNNGANIASERDLFCDVTSSHIPTHYRIGESVDLKDSEWIRYENIIPYTLSEKFGENEIFIQCKNENKISNVLSYKIEFCDEDKIGMLGKQHIEKYTNKLSNRVISISRKID